MVLRANPVAAETTASPPKPMATDSAAAHSRRVRSFSRGAITTYLATSVASRALLHESSLARTMPTDRILTYRCDTTLVGRGRSSD